MDRIAPQGPSAEPSSSGRWRRAARAVSGALLVLSTLVALGASGARADAPGLSGAYIGVDDAAGMRLTLTERTAEGDVAAGFDGALVDASGGRAEFQAFLSGRGGRDAETRVQLGDRSLFLRFSPRPIGLIAVSIPVTDEGVLVLERTQSLPFVREGVALPERPEMFASAPQDPNGVTDPLLFLLSYEFWTPVEVGNGYASLEDRWRTLIRLYAEVHTDVLWKLCSAGRTPPGRTEALEGQNITCEGVVDKVAALQRSGRFGAYKAGLAEQKARLIDAVKCARGQLLKSDCERANAWTNRAALSLDTAATVLARY